MIQDNEDNYADYVDDERGYAWDAWDVLSADVIRRHDDVLRSSSDALARLDPAGLDDLDRWAYARACRRHGDIDGFLDAGRLILAGELSHRGLDYAGIYTTMIETLSRGEATDEARLLLDEMRDRWPDEEDIDRLDVWIALHFDEERAAAAAEEILDRRGDDPELLLDLFEDARDAGRTTLAVRFLDAAENAARQAGVSAVLVDIALSRERLEITEE